MNSVRVELTCVWRNIAIFVTSKHSEREGKEK